MAVLLVHTASTLAMVGLIWFVQVVHYPLFNLASVRQFDQFAAEHQRRTAWVVIPLMLTEGATAIALALAPPSGVNPSFPWIGIALLALIWTSTAVLQVPEHRRLSIDFNQTAIQRLVASNWIRTAGWTARGWIALVMLAQVSGGT